MRHLVISVDYEIFGNGLGNVKQHMTEPTERMAKICEAHGYPLSIYFEVEEYLAFRKYDRELRAQVGYSPAEEIENQVIDLARRGHDFQLHVHPEWVGCTLENGEWQLDFTHRTVDSLFDTAEETIEYIRDRKSVIEDLLKKARSTQRVTAYRAGAFSAQPSTKLLKALEANDFVFDSSVVHGLHKKEEHIQLDYRDCPSDRRHWPISQDVGIPDELGQLIEVPIFSRIGRRMQQITLKRLLAKFSKNVPKAKQKEMVDQLGIGKSPLALFNFLTQKFPIKLDYHNMGARKMLKWIRNAPQQMNDELDIIMLIGHSKEHIRDRDLDQLLAEVAKDPNIEVISLSDTSKKLKSIQNQV